MDVSLSFSLCQPRWRINRQGGSAGDLRGPRFLPPPSNRHPLTLRTCASRRTCALGVGCATAGAAPHLRADGIYGAALGTHTHTHAHDAFCAAAVSPGGVGVGLLWVPPPPR